MPRSIIFVPEDGQQDEPRRRAANTAGRAKRRRPPRQQQKQKQQQQQQEQIEDEEQTSAPAPAPLLAASPASRAIAPYSANTAAEDRKLQFLIHHYCTIVVDETVTSVGPRYEWFPFSLRNPSFFHAVMASTSSHAAYLKRDDLPRDFFFHKGEAIRLVNAQIGAGAHDEGTINTVAIFSQQESFEGRTDPTRMHITGLLHLVQAAGGLESPTLSPKTRRLVAQTDQAACIVLNSQHFISTSRPGSLEQYFGSPSAVTAERTNAFRNRLLNFSNDIVDPEQVEVVVDLCHKAGNVFWGLRNLTVSLQAIHDGKEVVDTPSEQDLQFSDRIEVLERIVHDLWYQHEYLVFRLFGWTCLIYIYTYLRELPYQLGINNVLAGRIKSALEKLEKRADLNVLLGTFQDFFLWQMFLCGKVADTRDKGWFAKQAARILITRRIETEPEVIAAADAFLWPEKDDELGSPDSIDDSSEYAASRSPPSEVVASLRGPGPGLPIREKSAEIKSE